MDNNTSDKLIPSYNIVQQQQNKFTLAASSVEKPKSEGIQQNNYNPDFYAPNPISNPQANNQGQAYPYNPNMPPQGNYPYNPNMPPQGNYPYNPNMPPQGNYPYNPNMPPFQNSPYYNVTVEYPNRGIVSNPQQISPIPAKCATAMLLIMSILLFTFLIIEIILLSSIGEAFKNGFIIADEIGILIVGILFLVSFILSIKDKDNIVLSITRTIITICVWFVGFALRSFGMDSENHDSIFIPLLVIRGFLLFMAIPFSFFNCKNTISVVNPVNPANLGFRESPESPVYPENPS